VHNLLAYLNQAAERRTELEGLLRTAAAGVADWGAITATLVSLKANLTSAAAEAKALAAEQG